MEDGLVLTKDQISSIVWEVVDNFLIPKFNELNMNASGEWLGSLDVVVDGSKAYILGNDYTYYLENGRRPGKRPPIEPLIRWVTAKFGLTGVQAKSAAFGIATKIAKEGTTHFQSGGTELLKVLNSEDCIKFIQNKITEMLKESVKEKLIEVLKKVK